MVEELESEHKDVTEYYLYSYHHNIGKNSSDPELMMIEYLDIVQMFEESTMKQIKECEKMGKSLKEYFPMDGSEDNDDCFYKVIFNCTEIL